LSDIWPEITSRRALITAFLALLELTRLRAIYLRQEKAFGEITARANPDYELSKSFSPALGHRISREGTGQPRRDSQSAAGRRPQRAKGKAERIDRTIPHAGTRHRDSRSCGWVTFFDQTRTSRDSKALP